MSGVVMRGNRPLNHTVVARRYCYEDTAAAAILLVWNGISPRLEWLREMLLHDPSWKDTPANAPNGRHGCHDSTEKVPVAVYVASPRHLA